MVTLAAYIYSARLYIERISVLSAFSRYDSES